MSKDLLEKVLNQSQTPVNIRSIKENVLFKTDEAQLESSFNIQVPLGLVPGVSQVNAIGRAPNLAINTEVAVWDQQTIYTYLAADTELFISSSDPGDTQTYFIQGMTDDYVLKSGAVVANGQNQVSIGEYFRIFRVTNIGTTNNAGDIYIAESDTLTGGVPDTPSKIKGRIVIGGNVSHQAVYTVPLGSTFILTFYSTHAQRGGDVDFTFMVRNFGSVFLRFFDLDVFQTQVDFALRYGFPISQRTDIEIRSVSDTNNIRASCALSGLLVSNSLFS